MAGVIEELSLLAALYVANHMRPENRRDLEALAGPITPELYAMNRYTAEGMGWTFQDDSPYLIAGIERERPGVGTWWLLATPALEKHALTAARFGRNVVNSLLTTGEYHRIQAFCLADWRGACRMAEAIGLKREAVMRRAGIGKEDIAIFAATRA